jgi:hypothetical protein
LAIGVVKRIPNVSTYRFINVGGETLARVVFGYRTSVKGDRFDRLETGGLVAFEVIGEPRKSRRRLAIDVIPGGPQGGPTVKPSRRRRVVQKDDR